MNRNPELQKFVDGMALEMFGISNSTAIREGICVCCHKPAVEFKDELSKKEYGMSALCQNCQNDIFGE